MLLLEQLEAIMPNGKRRLPEFVDAFNETLEEFEIDTPERQAMFIAQVAHESGELRYMRELASGALYEGRKDLGNTEPGDGVRFKGRGLIQITGRANYQACGDALGLDLINEPELLEQLPDACRSAGWFWQSRKLNEVADTGDFIKVTRRINGGTNGLADRRKFWERAKKVLEIT